MANQNINIRNKRAGFDYELVEKITAGIILTGTEIKSVREGKATINEAYCYFDNNGNLWIKNMHISEYKFGNIHNHDPIRERKLLLKKKELSKFHDKVKEKGLTVVPVKLFLSERGWAKLVVALAKGKKVHDKRSTIKERDIKKEMDREMKRY
ncbi:MAG: SsrA-binding protein SmpB [Chitinophagaceae bacterium]|nr:MAG: SsrA-binding protein SmpB [Chitinophagaceae bacterium]